MTLRGIRRITSSFRITVERIRGTHRVAVVGIRAYDVVSHVEPDVRECPPTTEMTFESLEEEHFWSGGRGCGCNTTTKGKARGSVPHYVCERNPITGPPQRPRTCFYVGAAENAEKDPLSPQQLSASVYFFFP